jgi:DNA-binding response OmpR family regulator
VKPDLLMLDIEMPPVNGIHLCQEIRNDLRWEYLPILMISASTDDDTIQRVFMAGADDYVSKPIRAAELVARVIRRLEHAVALKRLRDREG